MVDARNKEDFRPYAAPSNIQGFLARARSRNLPDIITTEFLRVAGIPEVVFGRVMQALRFLKLVTEDDCPTDTLVALSGATDTQYREILEKVVRDAYRREFQIIDPATDNQPKIIDAFRPFQPRSQTERMVMLFLGLCREAGIPVLDAPRERKMHETPSKRTRSSAQMSGGVDKRIATQRTPEISAPPVTQNNMIFGVTEEDVARLEDEEFDEVWSALGKVARARARARVEEGRESLETEGTGGESMMCPVCHGYNGSPSNVSAHIRQKFDPEHIEWLDAHKDEVGCDSLTLLETGKWSPLTSYLGKLQSQNKT
jgi:hypothetical protein